MRIKVNGKLEEVEDNMRLLDLLKEKNIRIEAVVVELNGKILEKAELKDVVLKEGDEIEFLYYMGGGTEL
ncbi:sulfur carrier protein ThiS [Thermotoga sp. SG1]|uniref:sulfur carrier protein ThiS n=1 Tax=Thermotoga sp. SG1 TaxID=126739 RepID=UPI000C76E2BE|nr:sulfur carrier protein ThiS [Thermotoga sp. SG1]PLV56290.1 hypothetical protein AS006_06950 [Thermotoga sp. SG1]